MCMLQSNHSKLPHMCNDKNRDFGGKACSSSGALCFSLCPAVFLRGKATTISHYYYPKSGILILPPSFSFLKQNHSMLKDSKYVLRDTLAQISGTLLTYFLLTLVSTFTLFYILKYIICLLKSRF